MWFDAMLGAAVTAVILLLRAHLPSCAARELLLVAAVAQMAAGVQWAAVVIAHRHENERSPAALECACDASDAQVWAAKTWMASAVMAAGAALPADTGATAPPGSAVATGFLVLHCAASATSAAVGVHQRPPVWHPAGKDYAARSIETARMAHAVPLARSVAHAMWLLAVVAHAGWSPWLGLSAGFTAAAAGITTCILKRRERQRLRVMGVKACGPLYFVRPRIPRPTGANEPEP